MQLAYHWPHRNQLNSVLNQLSGDGADDSPPPDPTQRSASPVLLAPFSPELPLSSFLDYRVSPSASSEVSEVSATFVVDNESVVIADSNRIAPARPPPLSPTLSPRLPVFVRLGTDTSVEVVLPNAYAHQKVSTALAALTLTPGVVRFHPLAKPADGQQMLIDTQDPVEFHRVVDAILPVLLLDYQVTTYVTTTDQADVAGLARSLSVSTLSSDQRPTPSRKRQKAWDR